MWHDRLLCVHNAWRTGFRLIAKKSDLFKNAEQVLQHLNAFRYGVLTRRAGLGQV
jgi:hypothetical protein